MKNPALTKRKYIKKVIFKKKKNACPSDIQQLLITTQVSCLHSLQVNTLKGYK